MKKSVWLHNIRSVYNVGSIFRTADSVGIDHIYLSGYTPHPIDRFGRKRADLHKCALGAEEHVSWSVCEDIQDMKEDGRYLVAVEQDDRSQDYRSYVPASCRELVLVMGEETEGIPKEVLDLCDTILEIPMHGSKESLNVSVAFGIVAYHLFG